MRIQTAEARGKLPSQALAHEQHHNIRTHISLDVYDLLFLALLPKLPFNHVSKHSLNIVPHNSTSAAYCFICEKEQCSDSSHAFPEQIAMLPTYPPGFLLWIHNRNTWWEGKSILMDICLWEEDHKKYISQNHLVCCSYIRERWKEASQWNWHMDI